MTTGIRESWEWKLIDGSRCGLREQEYLNLSDNKTKDRSITGSVLDKDLIDYETICVEKRKTYYNNVSSRNKPGKGSHLHQIFILPSQRSKFFYIGNQTKAKICDIILNTIQEISKNGDGLVADTLRKQWEKEECKGMKQCYLQFYNEVISALEDTLAMQEEEGMIHIGIGPTHLKNTFAECNIPQVSPTTLKNFENKVGKVIETVALWTPAKQPRSKRSNCP